MPAPTVDPARARQTFPKQDRLLRRFEFLSAQREGRRVQTPHFTLVLRVRGDLDGPRLGITASRKTADSVGRNRVRRLVREVFRRNRGAFPDGHDCVVIAREKIPPLTAAEVEIEILRALARRGSDRAPRSDAGPRRRGPVRP